MQRCFPIYNAFRLGLLVLVSYLLTPLPVPAKTAGEPKTYLPFVSKGCADCYFVDSVTGSDAYPGTSKDKPWKSLAAVENTRFAPGSTISFKRGSSWAGGLTIRSSGTQDRPIVFTAYGSGERPVFSNPGNGTSLSSAITIYASWVVVEGLKVQNAVDSGIKILEESQHNIIRDVEATNVGIGISIHGPHNLVTRNSIHDVKMVRNTPGGSDDYGANGVLVDNSDNEVSYNRMEDCIAASYDFGVDGGAVEFFSNADGNIIHHNWAANSDGFLEAGTGSLKNTIIAYNVSLNNRRFSTLHLSGSAPGNVVNLRVENNTIVENQAPGANDWVMFYFKGTPEPQTMLLRNNILYLDGRYLVASAGTFLHSDNLYSLANGARMAYALGEGEKLANPLFASLARGNFRLQADSPAIDGGMELGYTVDFEGYAVPFGPAPDMGAYERQGE